MLWLEKNDGSIWRFCLRNVREGRLVWKVKVGHQFAVCQSCGLCTFPVTVSLSGAGKSRASQKYDEFSLALNPARCLPHQSSTQCP